MTYRELAIKALKMAGKPLSTKEIWEFSQACPDLRIEQHGRTPWETIGAYIYTNIRDNGEKSQFVQAERHPVRFWLNGEELKKTEKSAVRQENSHKSNFSERDLHPLLTKFVDANPHFRCQTKTIFHEKSAKNTAGKYEWLHPDIVGVHFRFDDFDSSTHTLLKDLNENAIKLFSFELKKRVDFANLRECFFQAVSNSSWANEGYLVALEFDGDADFIDELRRLNNAFGIGIISLNAQNIAESEILFSAHEKTVLDWDTINRLAEINVNFKGFITSVHKSILISDFHGDFDDVFDDEKFEKYLCDKKII